MPKILGALYTAALILLPSFAHAHLGHVGEVAGHSHWAGLAALAGAALVAGLVALKGRKEKEAPEETAEAAETDGEAEAAQ